MERRPINARNDLISRAELKEELVRDLANTIRMTEMSKSDMAVRVLNKIDEAATTVDAVEVVRCAQCVSYRHAPVKHCTLSGMQKEDDDYCSCGERRKPDDRKAD